MTWYFLVDRYTESMCAMAFGSYHALTYMLSLAVYCTFCNPEFQWILMGTSYFLMFVTVYLLAVMSMMILLSRINQLDGRLLNFSGYTACKKK